MTIKLNNNTELVATIREKLKENDGYCPCALVQNKDTKCLCKDFRDKIDNGYKGECHCGLYISI